MAKMKSIMEKSVLAFDFISAEELPQFTTSDFTHQHIRGPQMTKFTVNHQPQSTIFYEVFKGFAEVVLYNINKRECNAGGMSLDAVPYLKTQLIGPRPQGKHKYANTKFTWNEDFYVDISCMNNHV